MPTRSAKARTGATNIREAIKAMKKASRPAAMRQAPQDTRVAVPKQQKHDTAISVATLQTKRLSPALGVILRHQGGREAVFASSANLQILRGHTSVQQFFRKRSQEREQLQTTA